MRRRYTATSVERPQRRDSSVMSTRSEATSEFEPAEVQGPRTLPFELKKENGVWRTSTVGSLDWKKTGAELPEATIVRISAIVNAADPERMVELLSTEVPFQSAMEEAHHIVAMFKEFVVSAESPVRYTANLWFIFPNKRVLNPLLFEKQARALLPEHCVSYITVEVLESFLVRREYESKQLTMAEAKEKLVKYMRNGDPCSSLFLKVCPEDPELCKTLMREVAPRFDTKYLVGVRAIHKLAVSCTSTHRSTIENYNETLSVMTMAIDSRRWNFVVFKTLVRLASKNDKSRRINPLKHPAESHIVQMMRFLDASDLDILEKVAIRIVAMEYRTPPANDQDTEAMVQLMHSVATSSEDTMSDQALLRVRQCIPFGSPAACHLTGVLLEKCVERENFGIGWVIASSFSSVNEHTIEEVVTLCSKAFFKYSRVDKAHGDLWFGRVAWCVERHLNLLGKYPAGLALHVAAHRGDFDLCWSWYCTKRDERAFRFTAHHTSSVLKAATYAEAPCERMDEVLQAYKATPNHEKSAFIFEPLLHLWRVTQYIREENWSFWEMIYRDLGTFLKKSRSNDAAARKVKKLKTWYKDLDQWRSSSSSSATAEPKEKNRRRKSVSDVEAKRLSVDAVPFKVSLPEALIESGDESDVSMTETSLEQSSQFHSSNLSDLYESSHVLSRSLSPEKSLLSTGSLQPQRVIARPGSIQLCRSTSYDVEEVQERARLQTLFGSLSSKPRERSSSFDTPYSFFTAHSFRSH